MHSLTLLVSLLLGSLALAASRKPNLNGLTANQTALVRARLLESASRSWELGVATEALLEHDWPSLSVFGANPIPPPTRLPKADNASDVIAIATNITQTKPANVLSLVDDGSAGDPASLGMSVLLANWTRQDLSDTSFSTAAQSQLSFLINDVPRTPEGAISHRTDELQLWSDNVYMVPPFFAYYGALAGDDFGRELLTAAFGQVAVYREYLQDTTTGLWKHVELGSWQDNSLWATGNGWAAAGMLRVLQTMTHFNNGKEFKTERAQLTTYVQEIVNGTWTHQTSNGTLLNTLDDPNSFADSSSTALLAAATYRLAALTKDPANVPAADKALALIKSSIDADGWLQNVVDPVSFSQPGFHSPEGQAFVLLLDSAWRDYQDFLNSQ